MAAGAGPHKPGAAMTPVAGCVPALLDAATGAEIPAVIGEEAKGLLVLKQPWPSMARTCWGDHERFENTYFSYDGYYLTGDGARRDADGHYWITGRVDDVVVVSGHNIGTAEVESALVAHPAVSFRRPQHAIDATRHRRDAPTRRRSPRPRSWASRTTSRARRSTPSSR